MLIVEYGEITACDGEIRYASTRLAPFWLDAFTLNISGHPDARHEEKTALASDSAKLSCAVLWAHDRS